MTCTRRRSKRLAQSARLANGPSPELHLFLNRISLSGCCRKEGDFGCNDCHWRKSLIFQKLHKHVKQYVSTWGSTRLRLDAYLGLMKCSVLITPAVMIADDCSKEARTLSDADILSVCKVLKYIFIKSLF